MSKVLFICQLCKLGHRNMAVGDSFPIWLGCTSKQKRHTEEKKEHPLNGRRWTSVDSVHCLHWKEMERTTTELNSSKKQKEKKKGRKTYYNEKWKEKKKVWSIPAATCRKGKKLLRLFCSVISLLSQSNKEQMCCFYYSSVKQLFIYQYAVTPHGNSWTECVTHTQSSFLMAWRVFFPPSLLLNYKMISLCSRWVS